MAACGECKIGGKDLLQCSACKGAWYCKAEHQKSNWKVHKPMCKGVQTARTAGGIHKEILTLGTGETPKKGAKISCQYVGMLPSGGVFDRNDKSFEFNVGQGEVIAGWDKTLLGMKEGEKCVVYLTPEMGYGAQGAGGAIPPNCPLVFEITLLKAKV